MARSGPKARGGLLPSERRAQAAMAARARASVPAAPHGEPVSDAALASASDMDAVATQSAAQLTRAAAELSSELGSSTISPAVAVAQPADDAATIEPAAPVEPPSPPPAAMSSLPANVAALPSADRRERLRMLEALLFAAAEPLDEATLGRHLKAGEDVMALLIELQGFYASRGVNLVRVAGKWAFRTADDLAFLLESHTTEERRLSKAALETLSIIAYHQPVTRAEIEDIRGVTTSKGTLDVLMEATWIRPRGRRRAPGKPLTYGTTDAFLIHFGLDTVKDLPGLAELKGAGLLDGNLPPDFAVPEPQMVASLMPDELPLEAGDPADDAPELPLDADEPANADDDNDGLADGDIDAAGGDA